MIISFWNIFEFIMLNRKAKFLKTAIEKVLDSGNSNQNENKNNNNDNSVVVKPNQ